VVGAQSENRPIPLLPSQKFSTKCPYPTAACDLPGSVGGLCPSTVADRTAHRVVSCRVVSCRVVSCRVGIVTMVDNRRGDFG